jgi:low affinity Fe/Cu permease
MTTEREIQFSLRLDRLAASIEALDDLLRELRAEYDELLRSYDEGVAEFLGLEHVKPNILGNTRMVLEL